MMIHLYILGGGMGGEIQQVLPKLQIPGWNFSQPWLLERQSPALPMGPCLFLWVGWSVFSSWPHMIQDQLKLGPEEIAVLPFYTAEVVLFCNFLKEPLQLYWKASYCWMSSPTGSGIRIYFRSSLTPGFHLGPLWNVSCWDKPHVFDLKEKTLLNGNISSDIHIFKIKHFAEITMCLFIMLILKASLCSSKKTKNRWQMPQGWARTFRRAEGQWEGEDEMEWPQVGVLIWRN